ncbi:AmiR/NasT family two-component response regulator [Pseudonocardia sediminis]|uniref:AmiR/NasT family two-component response regulator n=1 Tax=Pseudonocardia sediminis TaxID=1397368 RepID=A0A4Q7V4Y5_PSEST|nr:GAF and ANTAR domain-containing protein [Pseudonocardia sediminis]RZT87823.1 AmiR/NasT family two-component response regulator [Pseudonocardia sediminis]
MSSGHDAELVSALQSAAKSLIERRSIDDMEHALGQIVLAAVETVPGAAAGGISTTTDGRIESRSPSGDDVLHLDQRQAELHEGPCITASEEPPDDGVVIAEDLSNDPDAARWPRFAPHAVESGYLSMMSTQLSFDGRTRSALNLYSRRAGTFSEAARTLAGLFAAQAGLLLYGAAHAEHLTQAVDNRDVIGQAKGILMERYTVDAEQAFQMLVSSSQATNVRLVNVARWLTTDVGRPPAARTGRPSIDIRPGPTPKR